MIRSIPVPLLRTALAALALSWLGAVSVCAQAGGGGLVVDTTSGGIFRPPAEIIDVQPPSPGGTGWIPPDAGSPGGGSGPGGGTVNPVPPPAVVGDRGLGGKPRAAGNGRSDTGVRGESSRAVSASGEPFTESPDTWQVWWESNKFDFIELRRVGDAPYTGQGREAGTPEQREARLAAVRMRLRDEILPALRDLTGAPDPSVRAHAAVAPGKLRDEDGVDVVRGLLDDPSLDVRRSAMLALGIMQSGRGSYLLMNIADDTRSGRSMLGETSISVDDRGTALMASCLRGGRTTEQLLQGLMADPGQVHPELLAMACESAGLMGSTRLIRPLIDVAFDGDLPEYVRSAATSALGRIGDPSVAPALVELLDGALEPRRAAAAALGYVAHPGEERILDRLAQVLESENDAPTRHFTAISMGRIGGAAARVRLLDAFEDAPADMRPWLALALGLVERQAPADQVPGLLIARLAQESNSDTRAAYLIALGLTRSEQGLEVLREATRQGHVELAGQAALALGLTGQPRAEAMLREVLAEATTPYLLRQAALGIGVLGDTNSVPHLLDLIRSTANPFVASYAALGIAMTGDEDAVGSLLAVVDRQHESGVAATFAVAAVGQLFDSDRRPALSRLAAADNYHGRVTAVDDLITLGF